MVLLRDILRMGNSVVFARVPRLLERFSVVGVEQCEMAPATEVARANLRGRYFAWLRFNSRLLLFGSAERFELTFARRERLRQPIEAQGRVFRRFSRERDARR